MKTILVCYASKHGSTEEIAQTIAKCLQKHNFEVRLSPVNEVDSLNDYDAVILGSAVYVGAWTDDAMAFLKRFDAWMQRMPVWFFSSGPTGEGNPSELLQGWKYPEALQAYLERIRPRDVKLFHGKLEVSKLSWLQRLMITGIKAPIGDFRRWDEIQAWAENIAQSLYHHDIQLVK
jgi:menaquinone-dependent protoporphyrinogen oxidase